YVQAQRFRSYWKQIVAKVMSDVDVLITPTSATPAPKRADMNPEKALSAPGYTGQWNLTGLPAMAVPVGFSSGTLPLSMQLIAKPFDEQAAFKLGDAYQRMSAWHLSVPPIAAKV